ncbi:ParB/RepB/Spo0J family partition protein [Halarcobacter sp.]|uniref:ParB/RepB/Spo0J family partition protein n=1 Tax=Halarcobacter sp. TaxID=2321133 RepID=UPI003A90D0E7
MQSPNILLTKIKTEETRFKIDKNTIKELEKSIEEVGLIYPIIVNEDNYLLSGYQRFFAFKNLGYDSIPCIVKNENELKEELIQIDENLVRKVLSPWEESKLIARKKEIYESLYPTSTKAFKSKNNSLPENQRVETVESFSTHMSNNLSCTPKSITNKVSVVDSIQTKSSKLSDSISSLDKQTKIKGIELAKIAKLSSEEMDTLSSQIEENLDNKNFNLSQILNTEKNIEKSMQEKLHNVFMYDLLEVSKKLSISKIENEIKVNVEEAKKFKKELNADFKNEIDFLIKNL